MYLCSCCASHHGTSQTHINSTQRQTPQLTSVSWSQTKHWETLQQLETQVWENGKSLSISKCVCVWPCDCECVLLLVSVSVHKVLILQQEDQRHMGEKMFWWTIRSLSVSLSRSTPSCWMLPLSFIFIGSFYVEQRNMKDSLDELNDEGIIPITCSFQEFTLKWSMWVRWGRDFFPAIPLLLVVWMEIMSIVSNFFCLLINFFMKEEPAI